MKHVSFTDEEVEATAIAVEASITQAPALLDMMVKDRMIEDPEQLTMVADEHRKYVEALESAQKKLEGGNND